MYEAVTKVDQGVLSVYRRAILLNSGIENHVLSSHLANSAKCSIYNTHTHFTGRGESYQTRADVCLDLVEFDMWEISLAF